MARDTLFGYSINTVITAAVIAALLITQAFTVIQPGYAGVSITLGSASETPRGNGLHFKVPFIENIIPIRTKQVTVQGTANCFSSDLQTVKIAFNALYRIPKEHVVDLYVNYRGDRAYEELLNPRIQDSLKQVAALYRAEDLVKSREEVKIQAARLIRKTLRLKRTVGVEEMVALEKEVRDIEHDIEVLPDDKNKQAKIAKFQAKIAAVEAEQSKMMTSTALVELVDLPISNIDLTDELEHAIEQKQIKEQEALAKKYELDKARKQAEITIVDAQAEAKAVQIKGEALRSSPEVIQLEIAKKWNGKSPESVVVSKGGANVLLPLK